MERLVSAMKGMKKGRDEPMLSPRSLTRLSFTCPAAKAKVGMEKLIRMSQRADNAAELAAKLLADQPEWMRREGSKE